MACFLLGLFHEKLKKVSIFEQNFTAKICGRRLLCKQQRIVAWCTKDPGVFFFFFMLFPLLYGCDLLIRPFSGRLLYPLFYHVFLF